MDFKDIIAQFGNVAYALCIFFGGRYGLKFFKLFKNTKHNFLLFATAFAAIFIIGEAIIGTFKVADFWRYLITYAVVTTCYDMVVDWLPFLKPKEKPGDED